MKKNVVKSENGSLEGLNVLSLPIGHVIPSMTNPRRDFGELGELTESIRTYGVLVPILVRKLAAGPYEIVAGERRWNAAKEAGLDKIPAVVMQLDDARAFEAQMVENLQRKDLTPLEEAAGYGVMLERGMTVLELCRQINKSRTHVFSRLRLMKLEGPVREALIAGSISASVAELLGTVRNKELLEEGLAFALPAASGLEGKSVREVRLWIERRCRVSLQGAPFGTGDRFKSNGVDLPACVDCPNRGSDVFLEGFGVPPDVCLDPGCFRAKKEAMREVQLGLLRKRYKGRVVEDEYIWDDDVHGLGTAGRMEWVDLSTFAPGGLEWREVLKDKIEKKDVFAGIDKKGNVRELVRLERARECIEKVGERMAAEELQRRAPMDHSKVMVERQDRFKERQPAADKIANEMVDRLTEYPMAELLRRFLLEELDHFDEDRVRRTGLDVHGIRDRLAVMEPGWDVLALRLFVDRAFVPRALDWDGEWCEGFLEAARKLKIDLPAGCEEWVDSDVADNGPDEEDGIQDPDDEEEDEQV